MGLLRGGHSVTEDLAKIAGLIEESSLGTPAAKRLRAWTSADAAGRAAAQAAGQPTEGVRGSGAHQQHGWLEEAIRALEVGDWRGVQYKPHDVGAEHAATAALCVIVRTVASSMRAQALGNVSAAEQHLKVAARLLPPALCSPRPSSGCLPSRLQVPPPRNPTGLHLLTWRTARLVWREQQELIDLRKRVRAARSEARSVLIETYVEYRRWVDDDPFTWRPATEDRDESVIGSTRAELCARATHIRRFATPTAADISTRTWRDIGGYQGLQVEALKTLAETPLEPWQSNEAMTTTDLPVRRGRLRAWERAKEWREDVI
jgi:hypothetical protein